jgi:phage-related protein
MYPLSVRHVNKQAEEATKDLPIEKYAIFAGDLELVRFGLDPIYCKVEPLKSIDSKVRELKINGRPAFRLVYVIHGGNLVILHAFKKTTNGPDKKNLATAKGRFQLL